MTFTEGVEIAAKKRKTNKLYQTTGYEFMMKYW